MSRHRAMIVDLSRAMDVRPAGIRCTSDLMCLSDSSVPTDPHDPTGRRERHPDRRTDTAPRCVADMLPAVARTDDVPGGRDSRATRAWQCPVGEYFAWLAEGDAHPSDWRCGSSTAAVFCRARNPSVARRWTLGPDSDHAQRLRRRPPGGVAVSAAALIECGAGGALPPKRLAASSCTRRNEGATRCYERLASRPRTKCG